MTITWLIAANRIRARVFKQKPFVLIKTLNNSLGREKNSAMMADKPGVARSRYFKAKDVHSMCGEKNPHEEAAIQFARRLCRYLERERKAHHFDHLVIAAEPKMLGRIRGHLSKSLLEEAKWLHEDFGRMSDHEIGLKLGLNSRRPSVPHREAGTRSS